MRTPDNITIKPYGADGFVVEWQKTPTAPVEFKTLQNREQLMLLLDMILDEGTEPPEGE